MTIEKLKEAAALNEEIKVQVSVSGEQFTSALNSLGLEIQDLNDDKKASFSIPFKKFVEFLEAELLADKDGTNSRGSDE